MFITLVRTKLVKENEAEENPTNFSEYVQNQ